MSGAVDRPELAAATGRVVTLAAAALLLSAWQWLVSLAAL